MNIKRAKQEIKDTLEAYLLKDEMGHYLLPPVRQRPVLLLGAPGIGKTQIMEQIADECQVGLVSYTITHHTRQSAIGLPFIVQKTYGGAVYDVTEYTMSEIVASIYDTMETTGQKEGILFIDEINCVSETLAPAMLQFLQCKTFGNHKIPEGWIIVAAGNPPEYNRSVREFDVVTMDRIKKIEVEPDFDVWKEYAYQAGIHQAVISYLSARTSWFYQMESTVDGRLFATPRGWEDLSRILDIYERLGKTVDREVVVQYIQYPKIARDFAGYLELYHKYQEDYQVDEILAGKNCGRFMKKLQAAGFDERLSVISLLLSRLNREFKRRYLEEQELKDEFQCLKAKKAESGSTEQYEQEKAAFLERKQNAEEAISSAGAMLERAFDLLEGAFPVGQEMVVFLTELNVSFYSVSFLQKYECSRYYSYNDQLMLDGKERAIRRRIDALPQI